MHIINKVLDNFILVIWIHIIIIKNFQYEDKIWDYII